MTYGYCPKCNAPGVRRERRIDGDDTCQNSDNVQKLRRYVRGRPTARRLQRYDDETKKLVPFWAPRLAGHYVSVRERDNGEGQRHETKEAALAEAKEFQRLCAEALGRAMA